MFLKSKNYAGKYSNISVPWEQKNIQMSEFAHKKNIKKFHTIGYSSLGYNLITEEIILKLTYWEVP